VNTLMTRRTVSMAAVLVLAVAGAVTGVALASSHDRPAAAMTTTGMSMPTAVPMQTLGTATWQGMNITVRTATALPFVVFSGTSEREVKPPKNASMHLMVMLSDADTGVAIPYASVWATIRKQGKIVFDERQWPMISRYMGPHYGNDVSLPGKGTYQLSLLITPPQAARHMEYAKVWLKPHRVNMTFQWKGM